MYRIILAFSLILALAQASQNPKVNRIFVATPYNASIIFEYANTAIPEDQPLREGAVDCLVSELKSTGLFTDIRVTLNPVEDGRRVNIDIEPVWNQERGSFVIEEIIFEGFTGVDYQQLSGRVRQKGIKAGTPLLSHPMSKIKALVSDTVQEMSQSTPQMESMAEEILSDLSLRVIPLAPGRVRLVVASGHRNICQQ